MLHIKLKRKVIDNSLTLNSWLYLGVFDLKKY